MNATNASDQEKTIREENQKRIADAKQHIVEIERLLSGRNATALMQRTADRLHRLWNILDAEQTRLSAVNIPVNHAATVLRSIYQLAAGMPHQPISIAIVDHPICTTADALQPVLARLEEHGWVMIVDGGETVLLTEAGVAEVVRRS